MNKQQLNTRLIQEMTKMGKLNLDEQDTDNTPKTGQKHEKAGKKTYSDVKNAFKKLGSPSMVDVMKITGTPDDEAGTNRSLFRKKVVQAKNKDNGSYYQFDDKELDAVRTALELKN